MSRFGLFRNHQYAVLIIKNDVDYVIHRTCIIPAWLQFPFMRRRDVQFGDVFTAPEMRRTGIALFALRYCLSRVDAPCNVYYVAQPINIASHRLAQKAGFRFFRLARKHPTKIVGYYSLVEGIYDYSIVERATDPRRSPAQIQSLIKTQLDGTFERRNDTRPLRILAVIPRSSGLSGMIFAQRQMAAIAATGHSVETFNLMGRRSAIDLLRTIGAYRKHIRQFQPDLIHAHYGAMTSFFTVYAALDLAPVVVTYRGSDLNPVPSMPKWKTGPSHLLSKAAALGAAHLICVSAELSHRLWWGRRKTALIPTGVDTTRFFPMPMESARRTLGWEPDTPIVLFNAGHAPKVKRLDIAEQVVAIARESMPNIRFEVLHGHVEPDDVPLLMNASDCLLFTSDMEGSPTVVQEAMACNLPVVSVPVGDVAERLANVVPSHVLPRKLTMLADALVTVLRSRTRSNGYEIAKADVGNEAIAAATEKVYRYVAQLR
jgi:glycosyltransferase involved in cell wall biosynthesis